MQSSRVSIRAIDAPNGEGVRGNATSARIRSNRVRDCVIVSWSSRDSAPMRRLSSSSLRWRSRSAHRRARRSLPEGGERGGSTRARRCSRQGRARSTLPDSAYKPTRYHADTHARRRGPLRGDLLRQPRLRRANAHPGPAARRTGHDPLPRHRRFQAGIGVSFCGSISSGSISNSRSWPRRRSVGSHRASFGNALFGILW